jgi:hypothetical protein
MWKSRFLLCFDGKTFLQSIAVFISFVQARRYWLKLFEESASKFSELAAESEDNTLAATQRAEASA